MSRSNTGFFRRMDRVPQLRQRVEHQIIDPRRIRAQRGSAMVKTLGAIAIAGAGVLAGEVNFSMLEKNGATELNRVQSHLSTIKSQSELSYIWHRAIPAVSGALIAEAPFIAYLILARLFRGGRRTAEQVHRITSADIIPPSRSTVKDQGVQAPGAVPDFLLGRKKSGSSLVVGFPSGAATPSDQSIGIPVSVAIPAGPGLNGKFEGLKIGKPIHVVSDTFVIEDRLGKGGMGQVWKARSTTSNRLIAVKELTLDDADARARFWKEAGAIRDLTHRPRRDDGQWDPLDGVVGYEGFIEVPGTKTTLLFMEFVDGLPVSTFIAGLERSYSEQKGLATEVRIRDLVLSKVSLLHYLPVILGAVYEKLQIMHRDLKNDNVFVAVDAQGQIRLKVLDWGLAKDLTENISRVGKQGLTEDHGFLGTFSFAAPENFWAVFTTPDGQPFDRKNISIQADMYSLGNMLYRALVGKPPFDTDNYIKLHISPEVPQLIIPDSIPARTAELLRKLLARDPSARPKDWPEVVRLFEAAESEISGQK